MYLRKTTIILQFIFLVTAPLFSQEYALKFIDENDLKRHLTFLASDSLQGRAFETTTDGLEISAQYLATQAKMLGLKPGFRNYFQNLTVVRSNPAANNIAAIHDTRNNQSKKINTLIRFNTEITSGREVSEKEIVLAGFGGLSQQEKADFKNKVVIVAQGNPSAYKTGKLTDWNNKPEQKKVDSLLKNGPEAIILVTNPYDKNHKIFQRLKQWYNRDSYYLKTASNNNTTPVFVSTPQLADNILGKKGQYKKYLKNIVKGKKTKQILVENKKISLHTDNRANQFQTKNVIAVVQGSDPGLRNECVVLVAHYDHLGMAENGAVFNGADDNASGTSVLLEVAEAFSKLKQNPKRSIVFAWVTCEETGMLGSDFYVQNPVFPLNKTEACINLDMVGRVFSPTDTAKISSSKKVKNFDGLYVLSNGYFPKISEISDSICSELGLIPDKTLPKYFLRSSDHYSFHKNGVPVLNYSTGHHADYHKPSDEATKINFKKMKRVGDLCFLVAFEIANNQETND